MTAPNSKLVVKIADELQEAYRHSFRVRSDAEDAGRIALAAGAEAGQELGLW